MRTLAINSALPQTEIALLEDVAVLFEDAWLSEHNEAERVLAALQQMLGKYSPALPATAPFQRILVVEGPGAFTGLRVGITIANTLAFVYGVPIVAVSTFEYLERKVPSSQRPKTAIVMRAGGEYALSFCGDGQREPIHCTAENLFKKIEEQPGIAHVVGDLRAPQREKINLPKNIQWQDLAVLRTFGEVAQEILKEKEGLSASRKQYIVPRYPAPPHITKSKKKLLN